MKTTIQLLAQLMQVPGSMDHRWAKQLALDVVDHNWRGTTCWDIEFLLQSLGLAVMDVSSLKWLCGLMRVCASLCLLRVFILNCLSRDMDPRMSSDIVILPWGSSLGASYLTKHYKKTNLAWFPSFALWFLLWLILISYNLCFAASVSFFYLDKSMLFTVCDDPRGCQDYS